MKLSLLISVLFLSSIVIPAQTDSLNSRYALMFGIGGNLTLKNFQYDLGFAKEINNDMKIRLFISPRIFNTEGDNTFQWFQGEQSKTKNINVENNFYFEVASDLIRKFINKGSLNLFGGAGLNFGYGSSRREESYKTILPEKDESNQDITKTTVKYGFRAIVGAEWFVTKRISIHSEYVVLFYYSKIKEELKSYKSTDLNI